MQILTDDFLNNQDNDLITKTFAMTFKELHLKNNFIFLDKWNF